MTYEFDEIYEEHQGNGYAGWSMSNNAVDAYNSGQKPISKWSKTEILKAIAEIDPQKADWLKKVKLSVLKENALCEEGWHHTSKEYNKTKFFGIDEDFVEELTPEKAHELEMTAVKVSETKRYRGQIKYLQWYGLHSSPDEFELSDVLIEERGCYYYVYDHDGKFLLRKKIGSNGTYVVNLDEKARFDEMIAKARAEQESKRKEESTPAANAFYEKIVANGAEWSRSGHIYPVGRKPTPEAYDAGIEKWFKPGDQRLAPKLDDNGFCADGYVLETWNGHKWEKEKPENSPV